MRRLGMRNSLVSAALLAAAIVFPSVACAQQQPANTAPAAGVQSEHHSRHGGWRSALRGINLTDAQKQQIKTISQQQRAAMKANPTTDPAARRASMEQLRSQVENVLTPAQRAQFEQNLQQQRAQRQAPPEQR